MKKQFLLIVILTILSAYCAFAQFTIYAGPEFEFGTLSVLGVGIGDVQIGYTSDFDFFNFGIYADLMGGIGLYEDKGLQISDWGVAFDWRAGGLAEIYLGSEDFSIGAGVGGGIGLKGDPYLRVTLPIRFLENFFKASINFDTFFDQGWRVGAAFLINCFELGSFF